MNDSFQFLQAFLKNPLKVGAIAPSSPELAMTMLESITPDENNIVLELGVGTGAITKFLREIIPNEKCYLGIELDKNLVKSLRTKFSDLQIVCGDASKAAAIHQNSGLGKVSYIVSCLPFASLPKKVTETILSEVEKFMLGDCLFRTFQYAHGYYLPSAIKMREFMQKRYGQSQKSPLVMKNFPPAYTLTWKNL